MTDGPCKLTAYKVGDSKGWSVVPASGKRDWMDATPGKFAYRCLPLVMANQVGWDVRMPVTVAATWSGKADTGAVTLRFPDGDHPANRFVASHFGSGILTFSLPWLFRTSPGYGLWVRGPCNAAREHAYPLDGIVETDWAPYTFTMNWRLLKRQTEVYFRKDDAICTLVPFPLALPEAVEPEFAEIDANPQLKLDFFHFTSRRSGNIIKTHESGEGVYAMDYMKGHLPDGTEVSSHRRAFKLREFGVAPASESGPKDPRSM